MKSGKNTRTAAANTTAVKPKPKTTPKHGSAAQLADRKEQTKLLGNI